MGHSQMNGLWSSIEQHISVVTKKPVQFTETESVSGGCINKTLKISDTQKNQWLIKTNLPSLRDMFEAEAAGLEELNKSLSIRIPKSICSGSNNAFSYLVLEFIPLTSQINQKESGKQLALLHQKTATKFGWYRNNTIGSTRQSNRYHQNWTSFWINERLLPQLKLAKNNGYSIKNHDSGLKLVEKIPLFFTDYQPSASLLHGDLWSGNCASDDQQNPVIYDPAVYYGDRETDIAMTELFGGFTAEFYAAYNAVYPLDPGYKIRKNLYNLYHVLNHYNLFGGSYASQAATMTQRLLSEV
jgi:fructosamine-3-kinase